MRSLLAVLLACASFSFCMEGVLEGVERSHYKLDLKSDEILYELKIGSDGRLVFHTGKIVCDSILYKEKCVVPNGAQFFIVKRARRGGVLETEATVYQTSQEFDDAVSNLKSQRY